MGKYHIRMSEEHITATLEAVMQKHDPAAAAITNEQERMIQEWGSDVIVLLSNQLSEAIAEVEALRARVGEMVHALELEQQSAAQQSKAAATFVTGLSWRTREETYKRAIKIWKSR